MDKTDLNEKIDSIDDRLIAVETKIEIVETECNEMIQRQKESSKQIMEIKQILTKNKIIHDKLEQAEINIDEKISHDVMPAVNDYNRKLHFVDNLINLVSNKFFICGFIVLFIILVRILSNK